MEEHETVLSDVHIHTTNFTGRKFHRDEISIVTSRFPFARSKTQAKDCDREIDEDGDVVVVRKNVQLDVVLLEHTLATPLSLVGLQVWNGALLLSDYVLHIGDTLKNAVVCELGSGTGLCTIVAGLFAKTVFCTDVGDKVLELCQHNVDSNLHLLAENENSTIFVKELDWRKEHVYDASDDKWRFSEKEEILSQQANVYLASDVIYDDDLTDAFFRTVLSLFRDRRGCDLYISIEKRLNFTLEDLDVAAPAYVHFQTWLKTLKDRSSLPKWEIERIRNDFPQCFQYERTKYLELWKIRSV